ncbi:MAG: hypothetical protein ACFFDW_13320 [Candidatus Thorarchaeota archaeon]
MAINKLRGLKVGRLLVLILLIAIPLAFIFMVVGSELQWFDPIISWSMFTHLGPEEWGISFLPDGWAKFMVWFGVPVFFSMPWVTFLAIDKDRVGETFDNMGRAMRKVSIGLNIFYSVNALFIFAFFILPFGSPIIAVIAAFGLVPWLIRKKTGARVPWWIAIIPGIILAAIPVMLALGFCLNYADVWQIMWTIWSGVGETGVTTFQQFGLIHYLYGFGYSVAIGAVITGFGSFIYEGASQVDSYHKRPTGFLYIMEFLVAAGIFVLYMLLPMNDTRDIVFYVISGISIAIGVTEFVLRWFKKIKRTDKENVPIGAYVMLPLFIGVDLLRTGKVGEIRNYALTVSLALACAIYFILFILAYSFAGQTYKSRWSKGYGKDDDDDDDDDEDTDETSDDE